MLRMFHDAQYGFRPPPGAVWRSFGPPPPDTEVICHHDAAPHNVIWRPDGTLALIDFDLASPGARIYDVAYAAWTWVPLFSDRDSLHARLAAARTGRGGCACSPTRTA